MQQVVNFKRNDSYTRISVRFSDPLRETLEIFRQNRAMRILAVVDEENRPIGVIREVDVRDLLFNPFGHALMSNPGFGKSIQNLVRPCAAAEQHLERSELIATNPSEPGEPGDKAPGGDLLDRLRALKLAQSTGATLTSREAKWILGKKPVASDRIERVGVINAWRLLNN